MEDREFLDHIYQMWTKTTGASKCYWDYRALADGVCHIEAVEEDGWGHPVANHLEDADADWITAVHGCFPDLIRRITDALDEADRLDREMDAFQSRLAEAELRVMELEAELREVKGES